MRFRLVPKPVTRVIISIRIHITSPSSSVNALANDHPVNFTRQRKFQFTESTSDLFKCTCKNISVTLSTELYKKQDVLKYSL